tara:strand:- start:411 stop:965 length:555 start_codon:yes stop_codon:yes gene_type:complete
MEFETYADVIDSYNSGVGVEAGETLTDYIKRNNIKIKEIDMDPIGDLEKILREGKAPMEKEGIESLQLASGKKDMNIRIEEVVKEFIKKKNRKPRSIDELKEFYMREMSSTSGPTNRDNVSMKASYKPGDYSPDEIEMYEQYKYDMNEQRPGMPIMEIDDFLRMEYGQGRIDVASGGLPAILGV